MRFGLKTSISSSFATLLIVSFFNIPFVQNSTYQATALGTYTTSLPSSIYVTPVNETGIRSYYDSLDTLATSERQGTNLLKNLKPILSEDSFYYPYTTIIWRIYKITDRDWIQSPLTSTQLNSYYSTHESTDDPYWVLLYRNDNYTSTAAKSSATKGTIVDREHVWPQSRGFKASSGAQGPAGTDLHHLLAGDSRNNQQGHSNYPWGDESLKKVGTSGTLIGNDVYNNTGYLWRVTNVNNQDDYVYEPQDSDKGNIARAIFYMAARYNNWAGVAGAISAYEPFLHINNDKYASGTSIGSTDSTPATMGVLDLLLDWHQQDPVDEYEIKRNDLIYRNFQKNRNPFIDYPEWAEAVYGSEGKYAIPSSDTINGYNDDETTPVTSISLSPNSLNLFVNGGTQTLTANVLPTNATNKAINWSSSNTNVATVSQGVVSPVGQGSTTITASAADGSGITSSISATVSSDPGLVVDTLTVSGVTSIVPYQSTYPIGTITVTANYTNLTSANVSANAIIGNPNTALLGQQTLGVSYEGQSTTYTVTITYEGATQLDYADDLIISEYIEGTSNNKYIEIYNGTEATIDLTLYRLGLYVNGSSTPAYSSMTGNLASGEAIVYKNSSAALTLPVGVTAINNGAINFNGNDALALNKTASNTNIDIFGEIGFDPGTAWTAAGGYSTLDKTLRRKSSITSGRTLNGTFNPSLEWDLFNEDTVSGLGSHAMTLNEFYSDLDQATAFATYVMFGIGMNANGSCGEVYETLMNEYDLMNANAITLFNSNTTQTITGSNELNQTVTLTFEEARLRLQYLSLFESNENFDGLSSRMLSTHSLFQPPMMIAFLLLILSYVFLKKSLFNA
jgi:endonuclease I